MTVFFTDGLPRYVFVFDHDQLVGEACVVVKDIAFIGNVWVHPDYRKGVVLFKMLKKLLEFANQHQVYEYEAH